MVLHVLHQLKRFITFGQTKVDLFEIKALIDAIHFTEDRLTGIESMFFPKKLQLLMKLSEPLVQFLLVICWWWLAAADPRQLCLCCFDGELIPTCLAINKVLNWPVLSLTGDSPFGDLIVDCQAVETILTKAITHMNVDKYL